MGGQPDRKGLRAYRGIECDVARAVDEGGSCAEKAVRCPRPASAEFPYPATLTSRHSILRVRQAHTRPPHLHTGTDTRVDCVSARHGARRSAARRGGRTRRQLGMQHVVSFTTLQRALAKRRAGQRRVLSTPSRLGIEACDAVSPPGNSQRPSLRRQQLAVGSMALGAAMQLSSVHPS